MKLRTRLFRLHRALGLVVGLQLFLWSTGGLVFSLLDIDWVRGDLDRRKPPHRPLSLPSGVPEDLLEGLPAHGPGSVSWLDRGLGPRWELRGRSGELLDVRLPDGTPAPPLSRAEAVRLAQEDFAHPSQALQAELLDGEPPLEYRGKPLPAWRVELEHPLRPHLYVDARTGEVTARRNRPWRIFDFFWMLHVMDYRGRDDFNHPLLSAFSLLAVGTSGTGLALGSWGILDRYRRRRRRTA